jgi:hypothetical protein
VSARRRHRKPAVIGAGAVVVLSAVAAIGFTAFDNPDSHAAENCAGLDTALQNNLNFIAAQQAKPDAQSAAKIANRQAVVDLIQQRRAAAGCTNNVVAQTSAQQSGTDTTSAAPTQATSAANGNGNQAADNGTAASTTTSTTAGTTTSTAAGAGAGAAGAAGQVVCPGSTVTLSGDGGAPAASSNQFPVGTTLKVTNLDNNKSTTVKVNSVSGSCVLLNNAAFEQVREAGKFLIRHARIEKVG